MEKKKGIAAMIVKLGAKGKGESEDEAPAEGEEYAEDPGLMSASEEIMGAIEAKDPSALADALKSFISMCGDA